MIEGNLSSRNECANIMLALPFKEESLHIEALIPNVTTYTGVISNQIIYDETSRVMELYMALQAIMDFNKRNSTVVPTLEKFIHETCPNLNVPSITVSSSEHAFFDILQLGIKKNSIAVIPDYDSSKCDRDDLLSIIGPMDSNVMEDLMMNSKEKKLFQITPFSFFNENVLNDNEKKNFARSTSDAKHLAKSFVDYLHFLKRDYVAILYSKDCTFCDIVVRHILELKSDLTIVTLRYNSRASVYSPEHCKEVLLELKWIKFSTIVLVEGEKSYQELDQIMEYSVEYGLVSKEHMWIVIPHEFNDDYYIYRALTCFPRGSKEEQFVRGISIYEYRRRYDFPNFFVEGVLDSNILSMIKSRTLMTFDEMDLYEVQQQKTLSNAAYVYDTVISLIFALCVKGSAGESNLLTFLSSSQTFWGATGFFSLDDDGNRMSPQFSVSYIDDNACSNGKGDMVVFNDRTNGTWKSVKNGVYFDGTAFPPNRLRLVDEDMNYLTSAEAWGTFAEVILIISLCSVLSFLVERFKDKRRVQLAQPFYLHSLCFSCVVFSLHIIPYGLDESIAPFGIETLDMLCIIMPIFRSIGYLFIVYTIFIKVRCGNPLFIHVYIYIYPYIYIYITFIY